MDWLTEGGEVLKGLPVKVSLEHRKLVTLQKINMKELEVCHPVVVQRERPFWRTDQIDILHAFADGSVKHTPIH